MQLRFAHLADYAAQDPAGKLTLVGVFDIVWDQLQERPIPFPPCYLAGGITGSLADGTDHHLEIRFVDADEAPLMDPIQAQLKLQWRRKLPSGNTVIVGLVERGSGTLKAYLIRDMVTQLRENKLLPPGLE
jgi:hypothetical protein